MLKQRLLVALIFLPLFVWVILLPDPTPFFSLSLVAGAIAITELGGMLANRKIRFYRGIAVLAVLLMGLVAGYGEALKPFIRMSSPEAFWTILWVASLTYCLQEIFIPDPETNFINVSVNVCILLLIGGMLSYIFSLRLLAQGSVWLLILFGFNWFYDAGAMFSGKFFGHTKLAPKISPYKTVEGMIGGLAVNLLVAGIAYYAWLPKTLGFSLAGFMALGVLLGIFAQAGDLVESLIKRWSGLKDSSGIIPGHGGVLDKIDSSLFSAPVLYWIARWLMNP